MLFRISQAFVDPVTVIGEGWLLDDPEKKRIKITVKDRERTAHYICFGTTGSGKTRHIENMVEQDIRKGYSVVVIDPKGDIELFEKIAQVALEEGREEDLMLINPIFPELSAHIDPLRYFATPEELAQHMVAGVSVGKEPYFFNVAYDLSLTIAHALVTINRYKGVHPSFNFTEASKFMTQDGLKVLQRQLSAIHDGHFAEDAVTILQRINRTLENDRDYFNKVSNSLAVAVGELTSGYMGKIIGKATTNRFLERLENDKPVIVVVQCGSILMRRAAYTAGKVFLSTIQAFIGRRYASGKKVDPMLCIHMDEMPKVLYGGIEDLFTMARGANVALHGYLQEMAHLAAEIGEDKAKVILGNCNIKQFMLVAERNTAEYASELFGIKRVYSPVLSGGAGQGSVSMREMEEEVIRPEKMLDLSPRRFVLRVYSKKYEGMTSDVSRRWLKVEYPDVTVK
ncbi:MAG: type IV secretion system DNA-binding domain-containing protein [Nitrospinae bacterium]|nr:type IV secretion system DNA-binding domain-containing protein [Nitrospinota bacterium]